ncbi:hypothetical protein RND71_025310 [Anisodus tanguticus]|uniref:Rhamnogalacturonan endolyase n=1 Tax=Anisodus tanguticus TaxID=243964 RepID=A0AAE1RPQ9_9SOLA|nr:hypothetical protein RND71_025310 [Anisodus tanguticus]
MPVTTLLRNLKKRRLTTMPAVTLEIQPNYVTLSNAFATVTISKPGGHVDDKYFYASDNKDDKVHGWVSTNPPGYQFWTKTDPHGNFIIKKVISGTYNLYATVPEIIGDYKYASNIKVTPGSIIKLGILVYKTPRHGATIWEIGVPDRTAAEFFIPNPPSQYKVHKYQNDTESKFKQYGLWEQYGALYPKKDLVYNVATSQYSKDWFFAHVTRPQITLSNWLLQERMKLYSMNLPSSGDNEVQFELDLRNSHIYSEKDYLLFAKLSEYAEWSKWLEAFQPDKLDVVKPSASYIGFLGAQEQRVFPLDMITSAGCQKLVPIIGADW